MTTDEKEQAADMIRICEDATRVKVTVLLSFGNTESGGVNMYVTNARIEGGDVARALAKCDNAARYGPGNISYGRDNK